jgi:hypothetical protein
MRQSPSTVMIWYSDIKSMLESPTYTSRKKAEPTQTLLIALTALCAVDFVSTTWLAVAQDLVGVLARREDYDDED